MDKNEWERSQHDADDRNAEEHDRQADARQTAAAAREEVPYMERHFQLEEEDEENQPHAGGTEEAHTEEADELPETLALVPADTFEAAEDDVLPEPSIDLQSYDIDVSESDTDITMEAEELNQVIEDICRSKAEEFRMLGYEHVTGREIWECVSDKYDKNGIPPLHRIVNDILSLKVTQFMNWMTMSIYKDAHFR